jgi:nitric oxide dioxygenase
MVLSEKTIEICKATAPAIVVHGEAITTRMYEILFENYPETKALFGDAPEDQHKRLAAAIAAYATNMDNLGALEKAVEGMAQRHVKTNVKPEHYPMVGVSLLEAIKDVLGDAATDDVIEAWKEAYFYLGDILIARENELYSVTA